MLPPTRASVPGLYQKAIALHQAAQFEKAESLYMQILGIVPDVPEVRFRLAQLNLQRGTPEQGRDHLQVALTQKPDQPELWKLALDLYEALGETDQVLAAHDMLIRLDPKAIKPKADKAFYLQSAGRLEEAETLLRKLLRQSPLDGELYRMLAIAHKFVPGDPLIRDMQKALAHPKQTDISKMHLYFALAKAKEDSGAYDQVFKALRLANGLQRKKYPSNLAEREAERQAVLKAQTEQCRDPVTQTGAPTPIFVTGMPRSGTTLVEQIIASHSQVEAGGELGHALKIAYGLFGTGQQMRPLPEIPKDGLIDFAGKYRQALQSSVRGTASRVTDKSIKSELVFGLLRAAMPDARFIVVHRDPRDIALSIYKNYFHDGRHRYANDLAEIAATIHGFQQTVAFWKARDPDMIHEVHYEELVTDPEPQARALIAAAGLEWEDQCLDFHKSTTVVKTLSLAQVRQPIHAGRTKAWQRYEADLKPFSDAWEALTT